MDDGNESLPEDIDALKAALIVARAEAAAARAQQSNDQALIAHLKLQIEKLNRDRYGPRSERTARLLDQLELTLEELESSATEDELAAEMAAAKTTKVPAQDHGEQQNDPRYAKTPRPTRQGATSNGQQCSGPGLRKSQNAPKPDQEAEAFQPHRQSCIAVNVHSKTAWARKRPRIQSGPRPTGARATKAAPECTTATRLG
jgi:hypothetical protein